MKQLLVVFALLSRQDPDYARDIEPLFRAHCLKCHGPEKKSGGYRVDSREAAVRGGVSGKAVLPGNAQESPLLQLLVSEDPDERMPRKAPPLPKEKIDLLRAWIDRGAVGPAAPPAPVHWAYVKPVRPALPSVKTSWARNPIDAFIAAGHERRGLTPRPEAPKPALLRRVTLDLIGLPPTREELRAFLADASPQAYEAVVDRLLSDPRHGERWGRHWMDVWRYSESDRVGKDVLESQPHLWRWRDWIVESIHADKGYDRMILEMLAADELAPEDPDTLRATGFLARNFYLYNRHKWLEDTVEHTSKAFLATTINCARCHDHLYDPLAQDEYYRFRAFFEPHRVRVDPLPGETEGLARAYDAELEAPTYLFTRGDESRPDRSRPLAPAVPAALGGTLEIHPVILPASVIAPEKREFARETLLVARAREVARARSRAESAALDKLPVSLIDAALAEARETSFRATIAAERLEESGDRSSPAWKKAAEEAWSAQRKLALWEAKKAGLVAQRAAVASRGTPQAEDAARKQAEAEQAIRDAEKAAQGSSTAFAPSVPVYPHTSTGRRLALARWIAHRDNPLTARVAVNHLWLRHFGTAIVPSVFDFGSHGRPPSHPELLDWLAVEFVEHGWSLKRLHRLMVTSNAYRMDSDASEASFRDPENQFLWRMNARRMEAEVVRDSLLYLGGVLDPAVGGREIDHRQGLTSRRRSLYYRHASDRMEFLTLFDVANARECYERPENILPQQALALANSSLSRECARLVASRLGGDGFVTAAFEEILGRVPSDLERAECERFLEAQAALLASDRLQGFSSGASAAVKPSSDPEQRTRENLVHVLLNHHDFITIR